MGALRGLRASVTGGTAGADRSITGRHQSYQRRVLARLVHAEELGNDLAQSYGELPQPLQSVRRTPEVNSRLTADGRLGQLSVRCPYEPTFMW
jgi:hypothetical protein